MGKFISGIMAASFRRGIMLAFCLGLYSASAAAQMFAPAGSVGNKVPQAATAATASSAGQADSANIPEQAKEANSRQPAATGYPRQKNAVESNNSSAGNTAGYRYQTQTYNIGNVNQQKPKPQIFIYMRDFKVSRTLNGSINCSMRFYVYTTLKEKLTNLSCRLKWPDMETVLVFDDVEPDTRTYFDYSLLGEGCYSMDKAPNIIVNRCRVKGMTQQQCAQNIRWAN